MKLYCFVATFLFSFSFCMVKEGYSNCQLGVITQFDRFVWTRARLKLFFFTSSQWLFMATVLKNWKTNEKIQIKIKLKVQKYKLGTELIKKQIEYKLNENKREIECWSTS